MTTAARAEGFTRDDLEAFPRDSSRTYELLDGAIVISAPGGLTRADRDALPDIGARQELIDGQTVVSAAPNTRHQEVVGSLYRLLYLSRSPESQVLLGPFDVVLADGTVIEPDIVVARRADVTPKDLPTAPLLSVEVLSPSTRRRDLGVKKQCLLEASCPSYWVIDPGGGEPKLTVFELADDEYREVAHVTGDETWTAERPFPVTLVPSRLLDD